MVKYQHLIVGYLICAGSFDTNPATVNFMHLHLLYEEGEPGGRPGGKTGTQYPKINNKTVY